MTIPRLSAAIITYNEENNIEACLDSLLDLVDEVVVVDSYSTDLTKKLCLCYDSVFFYENHFHGHIQQKNFAIEKCTNEWVLSLDADERVSKELSASIKAFMHSEKPNHYVGVKFPRLTYHLGKAIKYCGWYPNARYRLFKKSNAQWGGENPHDKIILEGKGCMISGDLIHCSFKDLAHQVNTINMFSSIAAYSRYGKEREFNVWRLLLKPVSKFIEVYLFKRGFLDGIAGLIIAVSSAYSSFLKEAKLYELDRLKVDEPSNLPKHYRREP